MLEAAGVRRAKGLVAAVAVNMFVVVSARGMNPAPHIVARVESEASASKLEKAGADRTLSPYEVGGLRKAWAALLMSTLWPTIPGTIGQKAKG